MDRFEFRADGLTESQARQLKGLKQPSRFSPGVAAWTIAIAAVAYTVSPTNSYIFNRPSEIKLVSSIGSDSTTVSGTVDDPRIETVTLEVNGVQSSVPVESGKFTSRVPLYSRESTIAVSGASIPSQSVKIIPQAGSSSFPGQVKIGSPSTDKSVSVSGTLDNPQITTVTIDVNGASKTVPVKNGNFTSSVPLAAGENTIQATAAGVLSHAIKVTLSTTPSGPTNSTQPSGDCKRIDCDCDSVEFGLLTKQYRLECRKTETELIRLCKETGKVQGKCHSTASGPKAWPQ